MFNRVCSWLKFETMVVILSCLRNHIDSVCILYKQRFMRKFYESKSVKDSKSGSKSRNVTGIAP